MLVGEYDLKPTSKNVLSGRHPVILGAEADLPQGAVHIVCPATHGDYCRMQGFPDVQAEAKATAGVIKASPPTYLSPCDVRDAALD